MSTPGIILQHGPHAPPGHLGAYLTEAGLPHRVVRVWEEGVPDLTGAPWVASLGSEHSAADAEPAWIPQEVEALRAAADAGVPILGLCFGGQALSVALGGDGQPHAPSRDRLGRRGLRGPRDPLRPYGQYHYELLGVPPGGREVARSPGGTAAFRAGPHLGLQFHPEVTREQLEVWLGMDPNLPPDFAREVAIEQGERCAPEAAERARRLFAAWFARVDGGG
jgi:GMP synthase-like glutamine amidotransferase